MKNGFVTRLRDLGVVLPVAAAPAANYVPFVIQDSFVFIAGQLPMWDGKLQYLGEVSADNLDDGVAAARLCALNILAQLDLACDHDLSKVARCVRLGGFVACGANFYQQPQVINGASELIVQVFGDIGRHARAAVGCSALPLNAMVEIDAVFALK